MPASHILLPPVPPLPAWVEAWRDDQDRKNAEAAARRARMKFPVARDLEKMGKIAGAIDFYRTIVRESPESEEGRTAAARIDALELKDDPR